MNPTEIGVGETPEDMVLLTMEPPADSGPEDNIVPVQTIYDPEDPRLFMRVEVSVEELALISKHGHFWVCFLGGGMPPVSFHTTDGPPIEETSRRG